MRTPLLVSLAARDPARTRLTVATAVSIGVLASAVLTQVIIDQLHAERSLLTVGIFLSVLAGTSVRDRSPRARLGTTALLIPVTVAAVLAADALSPNRVLAVGAFIGISGAAVWVRRFGPRAGSLGALAFMGYFFSLLIKPSPEQLPTFCLIVGGACAAQVLVRVALLLKRPRRELHLLLRELRAASRAALDAASRSGHGSRLRMRLARIDATSDAIVDWERNYGAELHIAVDARTLDDRVLDARVDIQEVCYLLARLTGSKRSIPNGLLPAIAHLRTALTEHATDKEIAAASAWAATVIGRRGPTLSGGSNFTFASYLIARSIQATTRLRDLDLASGRVRDSATSSAPNTKTEHGHSRRPSEEGRDLTGSHAPSCRLAVQAMVAATLASAVGEAISASHWYWAVITAFVIFTGATTRSSILTRAFRRIVGTATGMTIGVTAVALAEGNTQILVAICVAGVFGMLYFGPLNYVYSSFFMTVMLVALYRLLGRLGASILELRLEETVAGAVIGVLCAYLILSSSSRPTLVAKVDSYLDALGDLLSRLLTDPQTPESDTGLRAKLRALEVAQGDLDAAVTAMSTAFLVTGPRRRQGAVHLMYIVTRSGARLVQIDAALPRPDQVLTDAISSVTASASAARASLNGRMIDAAVRTPSRVNQVLTDRTPGFDPRTPHGEALLALLRMEWALGQVSSEQPGRVSRVPDVNGGESRASTALPPV